MADVVTEIVDVLCSIPALHASENRAVLLNGLPDGPVSGLSRPTGRRADLNEMAKFCLKLGHMNTEGSGENGRALAIEKLINNARVFTKGCAIDVELDRV